MGDTIIGSETRAFVEPKIEGSLHNGAQDLEGPGMGEHIIGSALKAFVEPKTEGSLVRWSLLLGWVWYG